MTKTQKLSLLLITGALKTGRLSVGFSVFLHIGSESALKGDRYKETWLTHGKEPLIEAHSFNQFRDWRTHRSPFIPLTQVKDAY